MFRSFNQLIINHLKDFILDDIQTINFLPSRLYYIILSRSRSPKRRHQDKSASSLIFLLDTVECEHARWAIGESVRNEGWLVYFSHCIGVLVLVFLLSSVLFHNHQILMASLAFFSLNTVPYYRQHWRWVKWTTEHIFTDNVLRKKLEMAFPRP